MVARFYAATSKKSPFNFSLPSVQQKNILVISPKYRLQSLYSCGEHVWNENSLAVLQCKFVGLNHLVRRISPITATRGCVQLGVVCQKTATDVLLVVTQITQRHKPRFWCLIYFIRKAVNTRQTAAYHTHSKPSQTLRWRSY